MAAAAQALADKIYVKEGKVEHSLTMRPGTTVQQLKDALASKIQLDAAYFNIINKGKTLDDGTATLSSVKVRYGAKLVMIKTEEFHTDKPQLLLLHGLSNEVAKLEAQAQDRTLSPRDAHILDELLTGMLEKIDAVDTMGRANLRMTRKKLVLRAQAASEAAAANRAPK